MIKPGACYFLTSLNFPVLSFKREGAKETSFLEVKLFTNGHISKWVRNSKYLLDYFGKLERLNFSLQFVCCSGHAVLSNPVGMLRCFFQV